MVLYVISTGQEPNFFPDLATTLMERSNHGDSILLNGIILKACQPDSAKRYQTATEMLNALRQAQSAL
jgi:hypothetical protein